MRNEFTSSQAKIKDFGGKTLTFVEYQPIQTAHNFEVLVQGKQLCKDQYHYSPYHVPVVEIKLENPLDQAVALDLVSSVFTAFRDSQALAAHNLWNLFMGEELRDYLPHLIVNSAFTHICSLND